MLKKLLASFLLAIFLFVSLAPPFVKAQQTTWYSQSPLEWYTKVYDQNVSPPSEIFGERYTAAQVEWIIYSLAFWIPTKLVGSDRWACILRGGNLADVELCLAGLASRIDGLPSQVAAASGGGGFNLGLLIQPKGSVSGIGYVKETIENFHLIPTAKAQGFGFGALNPIQGAWKAFRDIVYALMVLFIIVIAFMIMFRVKISPQTVISVQSALPKIVITLVLVTFSYAIAGFMIDLVYVVIGLLAGIVDRSGIFFIPGNWNYVFGALTNGPVPIVGLGVLGWVALYTVLFFVGFIIAFLGSVGIMGLILALPLIFNGVLPLLAVILTAIVGILLLVVAIRVVWLMIRTYVNIILLVIFAPLQIGLGAVLPGAGFGSWLRSLAANLAVYPTVGMLIIVSFMFLGAAYEPLSKVLDAVLGTSIVRWGGSSWYPPLTFGGPPVPPFTMDPLPLLFLFASLMIMFIIPATANIIKGLIERKPFPYGTAIGQAFGPVIAPTVGLWRTGSGAVGGGLKGYIGSRLPGFLGEGYRGRREIGDEDRPPRQT